MFDDWKRVEPFPSNISKSLQGNGTNHMDDFLHWYAIKSKYGIQENSIQQMVDSKKMFENTSRDNLTHQFVFGISTFTVE